jgi:hypothetical protein
MISISGDLEKLCSELGDDTKKYFRKVSDAVG